MNDIYKTPESSLNESETIENVKPKRIIWVLLTTLAVIGTYAAILIPSFKGVNISPQSGMSSIFWSSLWFLAIWKYRSKNGWIGLYRRNYWFISIYGWRIYSWFCTRCNWNLTSASSRSLALTGRTKGYRLLFAPYANRWAHKCVYYL